MVDSIDGERSRRVTKGLSEASWGSGPTPSKGEHGGSSHDAFDEHEVDTARRAYPQEIVEGTKRTTKMARVDSADLRTASGTRAVLTPDVIERHVRAKMGGSLSSAIEEEDAHSRPTIEAGFVHARPQSQESGWAPSPLEPFAPATPSSRPTPPSAAVPVRSSERSPVAGWVIAVVLLGLVLMVSAAGTVGFFLGRRSVHR
jgi:hypothetical protein